MVKYYALIRVSREDYITLSRQHVKAWEFKYLTKTGLVYITNSKMFAVDQAREFNRAKDDGIYYVEQVGFIDAASYDK